MKYFEDYLPGERQVLGSRSVTEAEILAFARKYDRQVFHVDPEAAKATIFGGLVASGWHTCAIMMRLSADAMQAEGEAGLGSPGVDSCRWRRPVRPGDTLTLTREVLETWPSRSRPFGFVKSRAELVNQRGEVVLDVVGIGMFAKRGAARV